MKKLFTETDPKWIDTDNITLEFLEDNSFLWASERDGNRHLYWYDQDGKLKKQITKGNWEVTDYYGFNPKSKEVYIQTTQSGSINKVVSKVNIESGKAEIISETILQISARIINISSKLHLLQKNHILSP